MPLSNLDIFSALQDITATADSTNALYVGTFAGRGEPIDILIRVTETFLTNTTLTITLSQSATEGGSYEIASSTKAIPVAELVIGYKAKIQYVPLVENPWLKLTYTIVGSSATAGQIDAALEAGPDHVYKDGLYFSPRNSTGAASSA